MVELHNQIKHCIEYPVSFSLPCPLLHTYTVGKPTPTSPRDPSVTEVFGSPLKRKGFYLCYCLGSSRTRRSRSSQAWRPQVRTVLLVFPWASPFHVLWPCQKETQAEHGCQAACSAQTWQWPHTQLLLLLLVKVPRLDTVKYPRVRGKPQWFSSHSCYTICTVEKRLSR